MGKRRFGNCILAGLMLVSFIGLATAGSNKTADLEQKIYEISALRAKIIDKIDRGMEMRGRLQQRLNEFRDEIQTEQGRIGIHSHQAAFENLRIQYNLSLIQQLQAYIDQLDQRIAYFQAGNERLKFQLDQIKDDMAIIHTLKDMQIENLIDRIDFVLDEFIPETQKQIFNAADVRLMPTDRLWNEIIATK
jgi:chromosome segregation ATPase